MEHEIREDMVSLAVTFLKDARVRNRPSNEKEAFLKRKGLNDAEILVSFEKAGIQENVPLLNDVPFYRNGGSVVPVRRSRWTIVRDISSTIIVVVSASYGIKFMYKKYLAPLLYGNNARKSLEESLIESNQAVLRTLTEMATALQNMQETMRILLERPSTSSAATSAEIREIKAELVSLKGLLLSRKQFPTPPSLGSSSLPSWQLQSTPEPKTTKRDLEVKMSTSTASSTPEIINEEEIKEAKKESSDSGSSEIMVLSAVGSEDEA